MKMNRGVITYKILTKSDQDNIEEPSQKQNCCLDCCIVFFSIMLVAIFILYIELRWIFLPCVNHMIPPKDIYNFVPKKIGFGSCMDQGKQADVLDVTVALDPEIFIFLGDNIYSDTYWTQIRRWDYNRLSCNTYFQNLVNSVGVILSTWDDHDFGANDVSGTYSEKYASRELFLNFWKIPLKNERRNHHSIYHVHRFRDNSKSLSLNIVLLDLRFFRDKEVLCPGSMKAYEDYCPIHDAHIMDERQWVFLENVLQEDVNCTIIGSSTQLAHEYNKCESWTLYPTDLERFFQITRDRPNVIVISGDVHYGEISHNQHIWDITASGLTHFTTQVEPNKYRVGPVFAGLHAGMLEFHWGNQIVVTASIIASNGSVVNQVKIS